MLRYTFRRTIYGLFVLLGVNVLTFALFFMVNTPDDMARLSIGGRSISQQAIDKWKGERGYDKPLFWNAQQTGVQQLSDTLFYERSLQLFTLKFGNSDKGRDIASEILERMKPSLALAIPTFLLGLVVSIAIALFLVWFRATPFDFWAGVCCMLLFSISGLFYIIFGQFLFAKTLNWVPVSGYREGWSSMRFLVLPVAIGVFAQLGGTVRLYRNLFLEELDKEYIRTARAKGLAEHTVLWKHLLRNASLPILTSAMAAVPLLMMGSLVMEAFFSIPGLGSYTIDAINAQDFSVVRTMVFLGSLLYLVGLWMADISYTLADPRIRLE